MVEQTLATANPTPRVGFARERTGMASFRTQLALDRTTLAWIRTTLTMATFGLGMVGFFRAMRQQSETAEAVRHHASAIQFGVGLIVLGIAPPCWPQHLTGSLCGDSGRDSPGGLSHWPLSITVAVLWPFSASGDYGRCTCVDTGEPRPGPVPWRRSQWLKIISVRSAGFVASQCVVQIG